MVKSKKKPDFLALEWRKLQKLQKLWSVRVAGLWAAFGAVLALLPAVADKIPLWAFGPLFIVMSVTVALARALKQPGLE